MTSRNFSKSSFRWSQEQANPPNIDSNVQVFTGSQSGINQQQEMSRLNAADSLNH